MVRRLGIASIFLAALAFALVATLRSDPSSASNPSGAPDFTSVAWGNANCDADLNSTDVLYELTSFTHHQPATPAHCPRTPMTVFIGAQAYWWGDWDCSATFDLQDVLFSLKNLAGIPFASTAGNPFICFDWGDVVQPYYPPPADDSLDLLAIDTNTAGNAATTLGALDTCRSVTVGQMFDVDVVVKGIPSTPGLIAFDHDYRYDPAVLQYVSNDPYYLIAANNGPSHAGITDYTDFGAFSIDINTGIPNPGTPNGHIYPTVNDNSYGTVTPESGDGVLIRYTMKAIAAGTSPLSLHQILGNDLYPPTVGGTDFKPYKVPDLRGAEIRVGTACPGQTPTATPFGTPTDTPQVTPTGTPTSTATPTSTPNPDLWDCPIATPLAVPDDNPQGITISNTNNLAGNIEDMQVCLNIATTWVGDVVATLTHEETSHTVILVDRLGNHAGTCEGTGSGIYVYLTDSPSSGLAMEDQCNSPDPDEDIIGEFYADQYLADENFNNTFDGEAIAGTWTLRVTDNASEHLTELRGVKLYFTAE